jgi:3-hydroxyisobutyrate dehydrogenase-like beta-hydroxyacid dehydrogenase
MKPVVAIIAPGSMGSAVGRRLVEHGLDVTTSLAGRSQESVARAHEAGMKAVADAQLTSADFFLSIVPPAEALPLASRMAALFERNNRKPVYVDCNAVSPDTKTRTGNVITNASAPFVDAGIIGGPPKSGQAGPAFYASGEHAARFAELKEYGLDIRVLDAPIGAASALKMSYAGITKGFTAIGAAMMLAATRAGAAEALHRELAQSQPALLAWLTRQMPGMFPKAYRWVAEMEEIASFVGEDPAAHDIYSGAAQLYERLAEDVRSTREETGALEALLRRQ